MENDNKKGGLGEHVDFGARGLNTWTGKFYGIDPLAAKYPSISPYAFVMNNPIINIDKDGREVYYAADGTYLGKIGTNTKVMVVNQEKIKIVTVAICSYTFFYNISNENCDDYLENLTHSLNVKLANKNSVSLGVDQEILIAFAAVIDKESGGSKDESYVIGNVTQNYIDAGGSSQLRTLDDVVFYNNAFARGATQTNYAAFTKLNSKKQNDKFAVGAAINAIGFSNRLAGFEDTANGATAWDGRDLVLSTYEPGNPHRSWIWNSDNNSKSILRQYAQNFGDINTDDWTFSPSDYVVSARAIVGATLFTRVEGNRTERKSSNTKFHK